MDESYLHLNTLDDRAKFEAWLTRIAINSSLMILRRKRSHPEMSLEITDSDTWQHRDIADQAKNVEELYARHERVELLRREICCLCPTLRIVVEAPIKIRSDGSRRTTALANCANFCSHACIQCFCVSRSSPSKRSRRGKGFSRRVQCCTHLEPARLSYLAGFTADQCCRRIFAELERSHSQGHGRVTVHRVTTVPLKKALSTICAAFSKNLRRNFKKKNMWTTLDLERDCRWID
jgi:hypothetical protein